MYIHVYIVCIYACMHACMFVCMHIIIYIYVRMYMYYIYLTFTVVIHTDTIKQLSLITQRYLNTCTSIGYKKGSLI